MTKVIARVHPVHLMNVDWAPGGRQPSDQANRLGCESAENWQLSSTSTIATVIITQLVGWYSFYRPTKGGRLSRPKHCSKGAQPVLKTVYHSSGRDKHNCRRRDSNLDPLTPQSDALTTRLLRPATKKRAVWRGSMRVPRESAAMSASRRGQWRLARSVWRRSSIDGGILMLQWGRDCTTCF